VNPVAAARRHEGEHQLRILLPSTFTRKTTEWLWAEITAVVKTPLRARREVWDTPRQPKTKCPASGGAGSSTGLSISPSALRRRIASCSSSVSPKLWPPSTSLCRPASPRPVTSTSHRIAKDEPTPFRDQQRDQSLPARPIPGRKCLCYDPAAWIEPRATSARWWPFCFSAGARSSLTAWRRCISRPTSPRSLASTTNRWEPWPPCLHSAGQHLLFSSVLCPTGWAASRYWSLPCLPFRCCPGCQEWRTPFPNCFSSAPSWALPRDRLGRSLPR
jgi:hypothetical protein